MDKSPIDGICEYYYYQIARSEMLPLIIIIAGAVLMYRIAEMGDKSGPLWATVTVLMCFGCAAIPIPFFNLVIGIVLSYVAMFVSTMMAQR